jgi:ABC-type dipeptide/oligopeptide/nickel transport system permease subunit
MLFAVSVIALVVLSSMLCFGTNVGSSIAESYSGRSVSDEPDFPVFFALGLVSWLTMARVVRGQILSLKNQEFVLAAKATGVSTFGIIFRHLVPNALGR